MIIPEFIRFYNYSVEETLKLPARLFYTLVNSMYRLQAKEMLSNVQSTSIGMGGDKDGTYINHITKQLKGKDGLLREVKVVKR